MITVSTTTEDTMGTLGLLAIFLAPFIGAYLGAVLDRWFH